jgi:hypothetical protein
MVSAAPGGLIKRTRKVLLMGRVNIAVPRVAIRDAPLPADHLPICAGGAVQEPAVAGTITAAITSSNMCSTSTDCRRHAASIAPKIIAAVRMLSWNLRRRGRCHLGRKRSRPTLRACPGGRRSAQHGGDRSSLLRVHAWERRRANALCRCGGVARHGGSDERGPRFDRTATRGPSATGSPRRPAVVLPLWARRSVDSGRALCNSCGSGAALQLLVQLIVLGMTLAATGPWLSARQRLLPIIHCAQSKYRSARSRPGRPAARRRHLAAP